MSTTDHTKAGGKAGQRNRKAPPQPQKPDRKPEQAKAAKARAGASVSSRHVGSNGAAAPVAPSPIAAVAPPVSVAAPVAAAAVRAISADAAPVSLQTIATAYGDLTKKSLEEVRSFVEKLVGARSLDKAIAIQSEFAQHAFQNLVADTQKIYGLYGELAKQTFKPFGGLMAKAAQIAR
jgi:phasin family protein